MVSLIITTYNYAQYVERAIRSALDQSLSSDQYEIIVVNDCSTDGTTSVLENFEKDARIFNLEENMGLSGARNFGIKKAKGQFVSFLDADDYLHKDTLRLQKLFLEENNTLDAVAVDYYLVDERGKHIEHVSAAEKPIACGVMFRKDFLTISDYTTNSFAPAKKKTCASGGPIIITFTTSFFPCIATVCTKIISPRMRAPCKRVLSNFMKSMCDEDYSGWSYGRNKKML